MEAERARLLVQEWSEPGDDRETQTAVGRTLARLVPDPLASAALKLESGDRVIAAVVGQTLYQVRAAEPRGADVECTAIRLQPGEGEVRVRISYVHDDFEGPASRTAWSFRFAEGEALSFESHHALNGPVPDSAEAVGLAVAEALGCPLQPAD
jgi:hypothetical protein